jgi:hypothetical protein
VKRILFAINNQIQSDKIDQEEISEFQTKIYSIYCRNQIEAFTSKQQFCNLRPVKNAGKRNQENYRNFRRIVHNILQQVK